MKTQELRNHFESLNETIPLNFERNHHGEYVSDIARAMWVGFFVAYLRIGNVEGDHSNIND